MEAAMGAATTPTAGSRRHRSAARRLCAVLVGTLGLQGACATVTPMTPQSLAGTRTRVRVTYPTAQQLQLRAARGDRVLERVEWIEGWPTAVRGDTLELQIARWRADDMSRTMQPPDYVVAVPRETGARIETRQPNAGRTVLAIVLAATAVLALVAGFAMSSSTTI